MTIDLSVDIELNNNDAGKQELRTAMEKALEAIGMQAETYAKDECPVDTGNLRNSITHTQEGEDTEVIGTNVEYAPYVELGTSKNPNPKPFIEPAATNHSDEYRQIVEEILQGG